MKYEHSLEALVAEKNGKYWGRLQSDLPNENAPGWTEISSAYQVGPNCGDLLYDFYRAPPDSRLLRIKETRIYEVKDS